jgi:DNA-binding SARP family transcriptional activator
VARIHLISLGDMAARGEGGADVAWLARRPRLFALLVYCAVEGHRRPVSVDAICELFWPDTAAAKARQLLAQLLYQAARDAGVRLEERNRAGTIRVRPDVVWCDAAELLHGTVSAEWVAAKGRGEMLPGFALPGSHAFDDWLDRTRAAVRRRAVERLTTAHGPPEARRAHARLALELDPCDTAAAAAAIRALGEAGDSTEAFRVFSDYRARLIEQLDLPVPAVVTAAVRRACATPPEPPPDPPPPAGSRADESFPAEPFARSPTALGRQRVDALPAQLNARAPTTRRIFTAVRLQKTLGVALLFGAVAAVAVLWLRPSPARGGESAAWAADLVIVGDAGADAAWASAVAPMLIDRLAERGMRLLYVTAPGLRGGAPYVLHGSVLRQDSMVTGTLQVADSRSGAVLGSWQVNAKTAGLDGVIAAVADSIRAALARATALDVMRESGRSDAAVHALLQARREFDGAVAALKEGAAGVGAARLTLADSLAGAAAAFDPAWPQPYLLRARVLEWRALHARMAGERDEWRQLLTVAVDEASRAVELGAGVQGREIRGSLYYLAWASGVLLAADARAGAEADLAYAAASPHATPQSWATLSALHHAAGRHADAYAAALAAFRSDALGRRTDDIMMRLFVAAFDGGRDTDAHRWCDEVVRRSPRQWQAAYCLLMTHAFRPYGSAADVAALRIDLSREPPHTTTVMAPMLELLRAAVHASNGHVDDARRILATIDAAAEPTSELPHYAAMAYSQLGDHANAERLLRLYIDNGGPSRASVVHSRWFGLRPPPAGT